MPEKTTIINGMEATLVKEGPRPIYLVADGRFTAFWGDRWVLRPSMRSLEKAVRLDKPSVKLFQAPYSHELPVRVLDVAAVVPNWLITKDGKKHRRGYSNWFRYDAKIVAALAALAKERKRAEATIAKKYKAIVRKAQKVELSELNDLLAPKQSQPTNE